MLLGVQQSGGWAWVEIFYVYEKEVEEEWVELITDLRLTDRSALTIYRQID